MNSDILQGRWQQLKGKALARWGKLTNDDVDQIEGERARLVGKLRERYGIEREKAEREVDAWIRKDITSN